MVSMELLVLPSMYITMPMKTKSTTSRRHGCVRQTISIKHGFGVGIGTVAMGVRYGRQVRWMVTLKCVKKGLKMNYHHQSDTSNVRPCKLTVTMR